MNIKKLLWCPVIAILLLLSGPAAHAQLNSATTSVSLNATLAESLSVTANPSTVNFTPSQRHSSGQRQRFHRDNLGAQDHSDHG